MNAGNLSFPPLQLPLRDLIHPPEKGVLAGLLSGQKPDLEKSDKE